MILSGETIQGLIFIISAAWILPSAILAMALYSLSKSLLKEELFQRFKILLGLLIFGFSLLIVYLLLPFFF